ncbi:MAG: peptidoglycan DD-metalloendopeptidase family protein [Armatimonadia bacterium]
MQLTFLKAPWRAALWRALLSLALALTLLPAGVTQAQSGGAYYTVQEGDTLYDIAWYFHTTLNELIALNPMADPDALPPGKRLLIPGFEDVSGEIVRANMPAGESAGTLIRANRMTEEMFIRLNYLTSPDALISGQQVFYIEPQDLAQTRLQLVEGLTPLELAVYAGANPWLTAQYNHLNAPFLLLQDDTLFLPADPERESRAAITALLPLVTDVQLSPTNLAQGKTTVITAQASPQTSLSGDLLGYPLHFFPNQSGEGYTALQGIPRLAEPGITEVTITAAAPNGRTFTIRQRAMLVSKDYGTDTPLQVDDNELDPAVTEPEFALLMENVAAAPAEKLWSMRFYPPSSTPEFITSWYGRLRSYNNSDYTYFHSGLDYGGAESSPILAPAPGIVVYTGELYVRGNTTIISHGWGVYTGYWHQSQIDVKVGDQVQTGQIIGMMGATGRATGPHLHFDLLVGSVEVDPEDWLNGMYAYVGE